MAGVFKILERIGKTALYNNFRQQRVDSLELCRSLTDDDLKELGIGTIGDRAAFRDAINRGHVAEEENNDTDSTSRRSMVMQLFRPSRGGSRTRDKKKPSTRTWTVQFFCLADRKATKPPKTTEKVALQKAGLGLKKIQFKCTDDEEEVRNTLISDVGFPQLKDIGGFELLHCQSNCRTLQLITSRWSVEEFKKVIGVQAKIYIRPIQKNLIVRTLCQDGASTSLREFCSTCGESFTLSELRNHVTLCSKDEDEDSEGDFLSVYEAPQPDTILNFNETPSSVTTIIVHETQETAEIILPHDSNQNMVQNTNNDNLDVGSAEDTKGTHQEQIPNQEPQTPNQEQQTPNQEQQTLNQEQQTPNQEQQTLNQEQQTLNQEPQTPNQEPQTQKTDINNLVEMTVQYCRVNNMNDPVDILRFFQNKVLMGRQLDIENPTETTEGETNFILVDRNNLLSSAIEEIESIENLRLCLEVQFYGEESVDYGGHRKEFFVLALREIKDKYFNPVREWSKDYISIGKIMALSLLQNGKMPRVMPVEILEEVFTEAHDTPKRAIIEQLRKGLDSLGVHQLTRQLNCLIHLFTPNVQQPVTVKQLTHLLQPLFSPDGSNRRRLESVTFSSFVKYLREVASGRRGSITLQNILQFTTGADEEPVLGYAIKPSIDFVLTNGSYLPTSNTCINRLNLYIPEIETEMPHNDLLFAFFDYAFSNNYFGLQ